MAKSRNETRKNQGEKKQKNGIKMVSGSKKIKTVNEGSKQLRKLYNKLMAKDQKVKSDIVKKILALIDGKYSDICFKHDGCRILQGSIKYGTTEQKKIIISKLIPLLYDLINGKYSIYLSNKIFQFADNNQKNEIMKDVLLPNFKKILKYSGGITFIKTVFSFSTTSYQDQLIDCYIKTYLKIPLDDIKKLSSAKKQDDDVEMKNESENVIVEQGEEFELEKTREALKTHLEKQLELGVSKNFIFHGFVNRIFDYLDEKTQVYVSELFDDDFLPFLDNNFGFELICKLYAVATAKTRKKIIKAIREKLDDLLLTDNGTYFIIKIILFTDDTKIIEKNFLKVLVEKLTESFTGNKNLLKILWNIFYPFNKKCNTIAQANLLSYSKSYSNKKDLEKRQNELIQPIFEDVYKIIFYETRFLLTDFVFSVFLTDFIQYLFSKNETGKVEEMINNIIKLIEMDAKSNEDTIENSILVDKTGQITVKRILKEFAEAKGEEKKYEMNFAESICKILKGNLDKFINTRAIFIIVQIMENEKTKGLLKKELEKFRAVIMENKDNKKLAGMMLLAKLI